MKELLTPGGEHYGIGGGEGLVMTKKKNPPFRSPKRTPNLPPDEEQEVTAAPSRGMRYILLPDFF